MHWNHAKQDSTNVKVWEDDTKFHTFVDSLKVECTNAGCKRIIDTTLDLTTIVTDSWDQKLLINNEHMFGKFLKLKIKLLEL